MMLHIGKTYKVHPLPWGDEPYLFTILEHIRSETGNCDGFYMVDCLRQSDGEIYRNLDYKADVLHEWMRDGCITEHTPKNIKLDEDLFVM